jgi:hypothetical protein
MRVSTTITVLRCPHGLRAPDHDCDEVEVSVGVRGDIRLVDGEWLASSVEVRNTRAGPAWLPASGELRPAELVDAEAALIEHGEAEMAQVIQLERRAERDCARAERALAVGDDLNDRARDDR